MLYTGCMEAWMDVRKSFNNPNCLQMLLRMQVLPPVPQIEAVLEAHQVPHAVGVVSSVRILVMLLFCKLQASIRSYTTTMCSCL